MLGSAKRGAGRWARCAPSQDPRVNFTHPPSKERAADLQAMVNEVGAAGDAGMAAVLANMWWMTLAQQQTQAGDMALLKKLSAR